MYFIDLVESEKHKEYLRILDDFARRQGKTLDELIEEAEKRNQKERIEDLRKRVIEYDRIKKSINYVR